MRALVIPVGLDIYAVNMDSVREVVVTPDLCSLPTAPADLLGLFNLRGEIVPLFDTAAMLGLGRLPACPFAAVLRTPLGPAGLAATGLPEATVLGEPIGPSDSHCTTGIYAAAGRLAALLDVELLFPSAAVGGHVPVLSRSTDL